MALLELNGGLELQILKRCFALAWTYHEETA